MIFEVEKLNVYYGDVQALFNVNVNIERNKIITIIGPSGCGKTTFLRCLNRMNDLLKNTKVEGSIKYDGIEINDSNYDAVKLRQNVGMVFQTPNPFKKSIYKNITYGPVCQRIKDKKKLDEIVESCLRKAALWDEVKDKLHDSAFNLSGGQQQRLCIARALAMNPDVILLDEPTSSLDPISGLKIEELLLELKKEYTIIMVTHSLNQASRISDYVGFFYQGELVEYNTSQKLFNEPQNQLTIQYVGGKFD